MYMQEKDQHNRIGIFQVEPRTIKTKNRKIIIPNHKIIKDFMLLFFLGCNLSYLIQ